MSADNLTECASCGRATLIPSWGDRAAYGECLRCWKVREANVAREDQLDRQRRNRTGPFAPLPRNPTRRIDQATARAGMEQLDWVAAEAASAPPPKPRRRGAGRLWDAVLGKPMPPAPPRLCDAPLADDPLWGRYQRCRRPFPCDQHPIPF